ncbi:hypothetical protein [Azonexus sp. R2A61]|uniref:hypothetical protein n=1 Tax=Azonexus sp. R2A61 TaxID=2744443 RepID=UPI001F1A17BC|nr:hypothetical protein [Azonexus sp. R2A61]
MLNSSFRPPRPRLTLRIAAYALADVFGLTCVALGAGWLATGKALFGGFPTSTADAVVALLGGVVVMFWAITRILRELNKQSPEMQQRYAEWIAAHHPERRPPAADD